MTSARTRSDPAATALSLVVDRGKAPPPDTLKPEARAYWVTIVNSLRANYFEESDLPLLAQYCRALAGADQARSQLEIGGPTAGRAASPWHTVLGREISAIGLLSARLRLCPQSRLDRLKSGNAARPEKAPTWAKDEGAARYGL